MRISRRRTAGDRGVVQSVQVGLLVGLAMTIMLAVVPLGPQIGRSVARLLICTLDGDGVRCTTPDAGRAAADPRVHQFTAQEPHEGGGGAPDSVSDLPVKDCAAAGGQLGTLFPGGRWDSATLDQLGSGIDIGIPTSPGNSVGGGTWQLDGCTLSVAADRNAAENISWTSVWHSVVSGIVAATTSGIAYVTCVAIAGPGVGACGAVAGFTIGFVWNLVGPALDHELDGVAVLKAFLIGLLAAVPAGFAYSLDTFASETVAPILRSIATGIRNGLGNSWGWIQRAAGTSVERLTGWLTYAADWMSQHGVQLPGANPVAAPGPIGTS